MGRRNIALEEKEKAESADREIGHSDSLEWDRIRPNPLAAYDRTFEEIERVRKVIASCKKWLLSVLRRTR